MKKVVGGETTDEEFLFELVNRSDSSIRYSNIRVKGNGTPVEINVLAGEYLLRETDSGEMMDETGDQEIVVRQGETVRLERRNRDTIPGSLQLRKTTDDGGPREGFAFTVSGVHRNEAPLTPEKLLEEAGPSVSFPDDDREYKIDEWIVDEEDLQRINRAAEARECGEFPVRISTKARYIQDDENDEGEDRNIEAELMVRLSEVSWDEEKGIFEGKATDRKETEITGEGYRITFNDFEWCGSATIYRDANTGRDHTVLVTNSRGYGVDETTGKEGIDPIFPGEYTVTEIMTPAQKERYHEPAAQTMVWDGTGKKSLNFTFRNIGRSTPVKLRKTSIDGKIAGISFCLSGKTAFGDTVRRTGRTDEDGNIDFGPVSKGNYVIEETGWDRDKYVNNHRLDGYEKPAVAFAVTGEETDDIVIGFENIPYADMKLTKRDKATGTFLPGAEFSVVNVSDNRVEAVFKLVEEDGYPQVQMSENIGGISVVNTETTTGKDVGTEKVPEARTMSESDAEKKDEPATGTGLDPEWITISGLTSGKDYRVIETDGPLGYGVADSPIGFKADHNEDAVVRFEDERSSIGTNATDSETGEHVALADEDVTIVDTVTYENLIPGKEYRLQGTLMNRTQYLISNNVEDIVPARDADGKAIKAEIKFTPKEANGSVKVRFRFNGRNLGGSSLVAYEKLFIGEGLVTSHEDPEDRDQTIEMPGIRTNATAERTGMHIDNASGNMVINDMVSYTNLSEGVEYHLSGVLMDRSTGRPIIAGGREVRSEMDFTPKESTGSVTLSFSLDGSDLAGTTAVVFEELECNGKIVADHKDLSDPSQTVEIPKLKTVAERTSRNRIEDHVYYSGLIPGERYVMRGVLVDRKTGKKLVETMSEQEFSPEARKGEILIRFNVSARDLLAGGIDEVVAFETCDLFVDKEESGDPVPVEIASHRDINDENQMVSLSEPIKKTRTGDDARRIWSACILGLTALLGAAAIMLRQRYRMRS